MGAIRLYILGALVSAVLIALVIAVPTVIMPALSQKTGTLNLKVTDAPLDLSSLSMIIDQFEVHQQETDQWINVTIPSGQVTFDLVKLENVTQDAALDQIPPGNYTEIRMHILSAVGRIEDGEVIILKVPSDKIDVVVPFVVKAGETTGVVLDIQVNAIKIVEDLEHKFAPTVTAWVMPQTGLQGEWMDQDTTHTTSHPPLS